MDTVGASDVDPFIKDQRDPLTLRWLGQLGDLAQALRDYLDAVPAALRGLPPLARARAAVSAWDEQAAAPPAAAFALYDRLARGQAALMAAAAEAAGREAVEALEAAETRTLSGALSRRAAALQEAAERAGAALAATADEAAAAWAPRLDAADLAAGTAALRAAPSAGAARLLARAIDAAPGRWPGAAEALLDAALGVGILETPGAAPAEGAAAPAGAGLGRMGVTHGLRPGPSGVPAAGDYVLDLSSPAAAPYVYNVDALIDFPTARAYGPIPPQTAGLSYKLLRRFATVSGPVAGAAGAEAAGAVAADEPGAEADGLEAEVGARLPGLGPGRGGGVAYRTVDGGHTHQLMLRPDGGPLPAAEGARVAAGPKARMWAHGDLLRRALELPAAARLADPEQLLRSFEAAPPLEGAPLNELRQRVAAEFARDLGAGPRARGEPWTRGLEAWVLDARPPLMTYYARAAARVMAHRGQALALRFEARPARLFGDRAAAAAGGRREALLLTLTHLGWIVSALRRLLEYALTDLRAKKVHAYRWADGVLQAAPSPPDRQQVLGLFDELLAAGFAWVSSEAVSEPGGARILVKTGRIDFAPSLVVHALSHL